MARRKSERRLSRSGLQLQELRTDEQIGVAIVKRACEEPLRQIVSNSGTEGAIVVGKVRDNDNPNFGYNAATDERSEPQKRVLGDHPNASRAHANHAVA